jgi:hypothetical protein
MADDGRPARRADRNGDPDGAGAGIAGTVPMQGGRIAVEGTPRPGEPTLRWRARARSIEEIEAELGRIWAEPDLVTLVDGVPGRHIAARTNVMNLVVIARHQETAQHCAATIQQLTGRHPSRTLVVSAADPDGPSWLDAHIHAHCILPREDSPEVCAEMLYLTAGGEGGRHLDNIVAPLLIHDLPVTIWWPDEPPFGTSQASELLALADRLVVDGSTWDGTGLETMRRMATLVDVTSLTIVDFALQRQSRWREAIASVFDVPDFLPYLRSLRRIAVTYATGEGDGGPTTTNVVKPVYHVAWLASRLGLRVTQPLRATIRPTRVVRRRSTVPRPAGGLPVPGDGFTALLGNGGSDVSIVVRPLESRMPPGTTLRVELRAERRGSELRADVTAESETVNVRAWLDGVEVLERTFHATRRTETELLAEAIEACGPATVAHEAILAAAELAGGVLHGPADRGSPAGPGGSLGPGA